ncbi:ADP,ATP carrier protein [Acrasis kona]|uniref:ADP,ATP carrier protein n=1 Tax=Acrasis kona TaxID=1008807 RepID=A0AAW2ZGX9_9EUKA
MYSSRTDEARHQVSDAAHRVSNATHDAAQRAQASIQRGADRVTSKAQHAYAEGKDKAEYLYGRLRAVQPFSDFDEDAIKYGTTLLAATMTPVFYRPFRNLQILQQLDTHGPNQEPTYNGYVEGFKKIAREEGLLSLFKGGLGQAYYEVARFSSRYLASGILSKYIPASSLKDDYVPFIGLVVEIFADTIGYPICTACTRLVAQNGRQPKYDGVVDALEKISGEDDARLSTTVNSNPFKPVWYAGLVPHLVGITTFTFTEVLFKLVFDKLVGTTSAVILESNHLRIDQVPKVTLNFDRPNESFLQFSNPIRFGRDSNDKPDWLLAIRSPLAFAVSYLATYPFSTVSRRMQAGDRSIKGLDFVQAIQRISETEGPAALWKGLLLN